METFRRCQDEVIEGFNGVKLFVVDVSKVGQGYTKRYFDSCCIVRLIDEQGESIGRLHQTIQNVANGINIMSTTMGGMG